MINQLINSIALKLQNLYPSYTIYKEDGQTITKPAFIIKVLQSSFSNEQGIRKVQKINFKIICQLDIANMNEQYWDITETLDDNLDAVQENSNMHHTLNKKGEILDQELHYSFDITLFKFNEKTTEPTIQKVQQTLVIGE